MKKKITLILLIAVFLFAMSGNVFAQRGSRAQEVLEVKIASPVPRESPWGRSLDRIAVEWNRVTNGEVLLRVIHGGTEGDEAKMYRSLTSNTIQAAVFTSFGLSEIEPAILTLTVPFMIRNNNELNAVMDAVQPDLERRINSGDYFMLAWSKSGFVNFFSKDPVFTPDELRRQRLGSGTEAEEMFIAFRNMGFQLVDVGLNELGTKVAEGAVTAIYQNPSAAAAFQVHMHMKNMLSTNICPLLGGIVINQVTWRRIGSLNPRYQDELMRVTRQIGMELDNSMLRVDSDSVTAMTRTGLTVNRPSAAQEQLWYNEADRAINNLLGTVYDRALYDRINAVLTQLRGRR